MTTKICLTDVPKVPSNRFSWDNSCQRLMLPMIAKMDRKRRCIVVDKNCHLVGWCNNLPVNLMHGRTGQIAIMFWNEEYEYVWHHYPAYAEIGYENYFLETKLEIVEV